MGGTFGLAAGGAAVMLGAVGVGAAAAFGLGSGTLFGVGAAQAFAIGALAFNFTAFFVAPIIGVDMDGVELALDTTANYRRTYEYDRSKQSINNGFALLTS